MSTESLRRSEGSSGSDSTLSMGKSAPKSKSKKTEMRNEDGTAVKRKLTTNPKIRDGKGVRGKGDGFLEELRSRMKSREGGGEGSKVDFSVQVMEREESRVSSLQLDALHPMGEVEDEPEIGAEGPQVTPENENPDFDRKAVCDKIVDRMGIDPKKAVKIVQDLCKESSGDVRFNGQSGTGRFEFDRDGVLGELRGRLDDPGADVSHVSYTPKEKEMVAMQLVGLVERKDVKCKFTSGNTTTKIVQKACHAETSADGTVKVSAKKTSTSAEIPKFERNVQTLANTASLQQDGKVICFRSAKTHKAHLQEQRSKADIASRVEASEGNEDKLKANGLALQQDGSYSYQPVIFTMMDANPVKAVGTSSQGGVKRAKLAVKGKVRKAKGTPIENERKFLKKMIKANQDRFDPQKNPAVKTDASGRRYLEHQVEINGEKKTVREYPAIIQNQLFSSQSKSSRNRKHARAGNISGQLNMLRQMVAKDQALFEGSKISELLQAAGDKPTKEQLAEISREIKSAYQKSEDPEQKLVLRAFYAQLTGKGIESGRRYYDRADSGGDFAMLTGIQSDYLGLPLSFQCKSGNDRTIAATAHKVAQQAYKEAHGKNYDPENHTMEQKAEYKELYTKALVTFGFSNVEASRGPVTKTGKSGLKIGSSPAAFKYMNAEEVQKHGKIMEGKGKFDEAAFRRDTKYTPVLDAIGITLEDLTEENLQGLNNQDLTDLTALVGNPGAAPFGNTKCEKHLRKALQLVQNPPAGMSKREVLKKYKSEMRKAINSKHYQANCQAGKNDKFVKLINYMCFKEYTQVHVGETSQSLAEGRMAKTFHTPQQKVSGTPQQQLRQAIGRKQLEDNHRAAGNQEGLGQKVKGEITWLKMDPNMNGNPANVKCKLHTGEKEVVDVRTPTPTDSKHQVNPEFKAFLRHLRDHDKKYTMVNLQNRAKPPGWKCKTGLDGEHIRSRNLEALSTDPEFAGVIDVYTLDKNSHFYHQTPGKAELQGAINDLKAKGHLNEEQAAAYSKRLEKKDPEGWTKLADELGKIYGDNGLEKPGGLFVNGYVFMNEFKRELLSDNSAYHIPASKREDPEFQQKLGERLEFVKEHFFPGETMSPQERQDFLELSYLMLTDLYVQENGADYFNQSCKDCIDRGGGANWLMVAFMMAVETHGGTEDHFGNADSRQDRVGSLGAKLEEDALWARKRGLIHERLVRASNAIERVLDKLDGPGKDAFIEDLKGHYGFQAIDFAALPRDAAAA